MIRESRIGIDSVEMRRGEIRLATATATQIAACPARLVINNPVAYGRLHLPQIGVREMILKFRQIVIRRIDLGHEDSFGHGAESSILPLTAAKRMSRITDADRQIWPTDADFSFQILATQFPDGKWPEEFFRVSTFWRLLGSLVHAFDIGQKRAMRA